MPMQDYSVPVEYVISVVGGLSGAVVYQTRRMAALTRKLEQILREDRAELQRERDRDHDREDRSA